MAETRLLLLWTPVLLNVALVVSIQHNQEAVTTVSSVEPNGILGSSMPSATGNGPESVSEKGNGLSRSSIAASTRSMTTGDQQLTSTSVMLPIVETTDGQTTPSPEKTTSVGSHLDNPTSPKFPSSFSENQDQDTSRRTTTEATTSFHSTQHEVSPSGSWFSDQQPARTTSVSPYSTDVPPETNNTVFYSTTGPHYSNSSSAVPYVHPGSSNLNSASPNSTTSSTDSTSSSKKVLIRRTDPKEVSADTTADTKPSTVTPEGSGPLGDKGGSFCSTPTSRRDGLVSQCLIAIASLAAVATIFLVSTIVLCTKLSAYKHRFKIIKNQGTEMVCISSLLPDGEVSQGRLRIPKSNGALIPSGDDSEGDDLTLHSFLPENDRG